MANYYKVSTKKSNGIFLGVDKIAPEMESTCWGTKLKGVWVYLGGDAHFFECDQFKLLKPEEAVEQGRDEMLKLMRDIWNMEAGSKKEVFESLTTITIIEKYGYEKAREMYDIWKKEKDAIHIKDEVITSAGVKFVVTKIIVPSGGEDAVAHGIRPSGGVILSVLLKSLKKTGVHVDDLDSYLKV